MTTPDLSAIRARLQAATPGPWRIDKNYCVVSDAVDPDATCLAEEFVVCVITSRTDGWMPSGQKENDGALIAHAPSDLAALLSAYDEQAAEVERLRALINTPEVDDWFAGVRIEAAHQVERWGSGHDAGKTPFDWFWLIGYLAQKAADAQIRGDADKAKHHTISTAAALLNWHAALTGRSTAMRPGIDASARGIE